MYSIDFSSQMIFRHWPSTQSDGAALSVWILKNEIVLERRARRAMFLSRRKPDHVTGPNFLVPPMRDVQRLREMAQVSAGR
jgi:hypothetical protein